MYWIHWNNQESKCQVEKLKVKKVKTYPKHFVEKFLFAHPVEFARPIYFDKLAFKFQENIMILLAPIYF